MKQAHSNTPPVVVWLTHTPNGYVPEQNEFVEEATTPKTLYSKPEQKLDEGETERNQPEESFMRDEAEPTNGNTQFDSVMKKQQQSESNQEEPPLIPPKYTPIWFRMDDVRDYEKQSLPEFFSGNNYKTPGLYLKYRNFMVRMWRGSPDRYLTKIACRRVLKGDANAIMRVHRFLEQEGLINFGLNPSGNLLFDANSLNKGAQLVFQMHKLPKLAKNKETPELSSESLIFSATSRILSKNYRSFCIKCGLPCGMVMFQRKQATSESCLCDECYVHLTEPEKGEYDRTDIIKRIVGESSLNKNRSSWTVEENYKMIEAMAEKNTTWESLYEKMGSKRTKEDIAFHFLQFPIINVNGEHPVSQPLEPTIQQQLHPIQQQYDSSVYRYESNEEDAKQADVRQPLSEDLKTIIQLETSKYAKRLESTEQLEAINLINESKSNLQSVLLEMRLTHSSTKVEAEQPPAALPQANERSLNDAYYESENDDQENYFDDDDVDRYLQ